MKSATFIWLVARGELRYPKCCHCCNQKSTAGQPSREGNDYGFNLLGDWRDLTSHLYAGLGFGRPWRFISTNLSLQHYLLVDILGTRFDNPAPGIQPWDLGMFSITHRRNDLAAAVRGPIGAEDELLNIHWQVGDLFTTGGNYQARIIANTAHGSFGTDGINEFTTDRVDDWAALIAESPKAANPSLIPATPPPFNVFPDPYSHTLRYRKCPSICPLGDTFLTSVDLNRSAPVDTVGQGVWPGYFDTMQVADLDDDGDTEVFFGNFDGFFHVMEVEGAGTNNPILVDEYKSPWLGYGLWSLVRETGGARRVFLGDSSGNIHRVRPDADPDPVHRIQVVGRQGLDESCHAL